ncbi:DMT family transporter [Salinarimonas chemoclinalis]|uniref:DMT family transporter n=1 Tax=Salinarimonas chemoclinalis TaxID=3241599 RepID=UPI003556C729
MPAESPPSRVMSARQWAMLVLLALVWGGSFFFNAVAVTELPPLTVVAVRVAVAALALQIVLVARGQRSPVGSSVLAAFLVMGVLNNAIPFTLIVWGQTHIASGLAAILNATTPLFAVLVAHLFTRDERMTPLRLVGVVVGFVGVVAMIGPAALSGLGESVAAQLACLAAAVSYAVAGVYGRRFARLGVAPMATAAGMLAASATLLVPLALLVDRPFALPPPSLATVASLAGVALVSTAFAYILYFRLLATAGATNLLLVTFLVPVSAILLGVLVLGESLAPKHLVGMALIGLGLAAIDGRLPRAMTRSWMHFR